MLKLLISIGTGGELIKMAPVMRELQKRKIDYFFLNTGQHDLTDMIKQLEVKKPDKEFHEHKDKSKRGRFKTIPQALAWGFVKLFKRIRKTIKQSKAKYVLVHGDTMTTGLTSLVVSTMPGVRLVHIEAGLRSKALFEPFPEEISRIITDSLTKIHLTPTHYAAAHLKRKKDVYITGNTNIDSLQFALNKIKNKKKSKEKYLIAKTHRQENIKSKKRLTNFVNILLNTKHKIYFIMANSTKKALEKYNLLDKLKKKKNINIINELPYLDFIKLYRDCTAILTDGGGETEEATHLKKPCIVYRHATERQEAEVIGVARRVKSNTNEALKHIEEAFNTKSKFSKTVKASECPYGDGKASKRIIDYLLKASS